MGWLPFFSLSRIDDRVVACIPHAAQPSEAAAWRGGVAPLWWWRHGRGRGSSAAVSWLGGELLHSSGGLVRVGRARAGDAGVEGQRRFRNQCGWSSGFRRRHRWVPDVVLFVQFTMPSMWKGPSPLCAVYHAFYVEGA